MRVSVIATVRNEQGSIEPFLQSLLTQTRKPDEIVIADGGSTDKTVEIIEQIRLKNPIVKLLSAPGNIARGRNAAIEAANSEIIAATDAGQRVDPRWVEEITTPFKDGSISVVSGYFQPDPQTLFEKISSYLINQSAEELNDDWLPSSRSIAFKKSAWQAVGGYPEHLSWAGEDTLFDLRLKEAGYKFKFAPKAIVYWRPRPNLKAFLRQFYLYAKGDGQYWPQAKGYGKKIGLYALFIILFVASGFTAPLFLPTLLFFLLYLLFRARKTYQRSRNLGYALLSVPLVLAYDLATLAGYFRGMIDWILDQRYRRHD